MWKPRAALILFGVVTVSTAAITAAIVMERISYQARLPTFANEIKKIIDPHELQQWAVAKLNKAKTDSYEIPIDDVPEALRNMHSKGLGPEGAFYVIGDLPRDSFIEIIWGGGFGHWGIAVGAPSFEKPNGTNRYLEWIPGVYFWQED
jgi:hypothetical protein